MKRSNAIFLILLAEILVALLGINNYGWSIEGLQATTRFSGRLSLLVFSAIFLLHPSKTKNIASYFSTSYFLVFAIGHGIHLIELLSYVCLAGIPLVPYRVAGGFLAYSLIFLMPWFQSIRDRQQMGEMKFRSIGFFYLFYVWFIFFMTYLSRVNGSFPNAGGSQWEHQILMAWVCGILVFKLAWGFTRKPIFS